MVVLTTYADDESIIGALQAGALGYLTKDATRAEIGRAIKAAAAGQAVLDPEVQRRLLSAGRPELPRRRPTLVARRVAGCPGDGELTPRRGRCAPAHRGRPVQPGDRPELCSSARRR